MEKRKLTSLRRVLLQYLLQTALACIVAAAVWFLLLLLLIQGGWVLPAAQEVLPYMTAQELEATGLDPLCRYALFADAHSQEVLATNMNGQQLQQAMEAWQGRKRWHFGYTQYYMNAKLQDGSLCLLQFDYSVPYADPALRGKLPDLQGFHLTLGLLLVLGVIAWSTRRTGRFLARETEKLTAAACSVARQELDPALFAGARVREYDAVLQAMETMEDQLTDSLQKQWVLEQQQREQIIQLSHKLKTPLTIIQGNAELLAEDPLTPEQRQQVESILEGAEQTRLYLGKIRAEVQMPLKYKTKKNDKTCRIVEN